MRGVVYSVIVPTFNGATSIVATLDSLLRQTVAKELFEILVVDDGSTDNTGVVVREYAQAHPSYCIRYLHQQNQGPASARNYGISEARGSLLFFTDDDCEVLAQWIERHQQIYTERRHVVSVGGWYVPFLNELRNPYVSFLYLFHRFLYPNGILDTFEGDSTLLQPQHFPAVNSANLSVYKWVTDIVGPFEARIDTPGNEDMEFSERIRSHGFVMYYLPYMVLHHKELDLRRLVRMATNRARGRAVKLHIEMLGGNPPSPDVSPHKYWRRFVTYWSITPKGNRVQGIAWKVYYISFIYFWIVFSPLSQYYWRKKVRTRAVERS